MTMNETSEKGVGKSEVIAKDLYEVYCHAVGGLAFNGDPLPSWREFRADNSKRKQSEAWLAVGLYALTHPLINPTADNLKL